MTKYKLLKPRFEVPEGTIVYKSSKYDYGLASEDTNHTGLVHISVSQNIDGDYPFFTVPLKNLEVISE